MVHRIGAQVSSDRNRHVKEYLSHYISFPHSPRYAVMINGPWGVGKTFLVQKLLREKLGENGTYAYVSLFGLTSIDEIDAALFQAIYPALGWQGTKLARRIGKTALKFLRIDPELSAPGKLPKNRRCKSPTGKV